jgi:hypothetical protein
MRAVPVSSAEGWAAQQFGLPASWYADVAEVSGIGFPISGDKTTIRDHYTPTRKDPKK